MAFDVVQSFSNGDPRDRYSVINILSGRSIADDRATRPAFRTDVNVHVAVPGPICRQHRLGIHSRRPANVSDADVLVHQRFFLVLRALPGPGRLAQ